MQKRTAYFALMAIAAASITACGGGGTGGNDPVSVMNQAGATADKDLTVQPGQQFSFTATADSPDRALTHLSWVMQSSANAPQLNVSNLDCAVTEKQDTPQQNDLVSSRWKCTISGSTPAMIAQDAVYTFTASATNSKNSNNSASSVLRVKAPEGDAALPKVTIDGPTQVKAGTVQELACNAKGGYSLKGVYAYEWTSSTVDGKQVTFDNRKAQNVKATFPKLPTLATVIISCAATDDASKTGSASAAVEVQQEVPSAKIVGNTSGTSGESLALTCEGEGGYLNAGAQYKFKWSSIAVNGSALHFDATDRAVVAVTLPSVTQSTNIIATCTVTDDSGSSAQASRAVQVAPVTPAPPAPSASSPDA